MPISLVHCPVSKIALRQVSLDALTLRPGRTCSTKALTPTSAVDRQKDRACAVDRQKDRACAVDRQKVALAKRLAFP